MTTGPFQGLAALVSSGLLNQDSAFAPVQYLRRKLLGNKVVSETSHAITHADGNIYIWRKKLTRTSSEKLTLLPVEWRLPLSSSRCKILSDFNKILIYSGGSYHRDICVLYFRLLHHITYCDQAIIVSIMEKVGDSGSGSGFLWQWLTGRGAGGKYKWEAGKCYEPAGLWGRTVGWWLNREETSLPPSPQASGPRGAGWRGRRWSCRAALPPGDHYCYFGCGESAAVGLICRYAVQCARCSILII